MKQEISVSKSFFESSFNQLVIGTHSGIFHSDDVIAVALFCINNPDFSIHIVRSRDPRELSKCNLLVDVGAGKYDHHQIGGNGCRDNGIPYASAGLYWKYHGKEIIEKLAINIFKITLSKHEIDSIFNSLDHNIIQEIDKNDNGIVSSPTSFDYISTYLPNWREVNEDENIYEKNFKSVLGVTVSILRKLILIEIDKVTSFNYIWNLYKKDTKSKILEIPAQSFPWLEPIVTLNTEYNAHIDFVIFPYPVGGWAAQAVPPSLEEKFSQRQQFPISWAGQTINLPQISGVCDATFCHNGLFFIRAKSREGVINMCNIANST